MEHDGTRLANQYQIVWLKAQLIVRCEDMEGALGHIEELLTAIDCCSSLAAAIERDEALPVYPPEFIPEIPA